MQAYRKQPVDERHMTISFVNTFRSFIPNRISVPDKGNGRSAVGCDGLVRVIALSFFKCKNADEEISLRQMMRIVCKERWYHEFQEPSSFWMEALLYCQAYAKKGLWTFGVYRTSEKEFRWRALQAVAEEKEKKNEII